MEEFNLDDIGNQIVTMIQKKIDNEGLTATGNLKKSVHFVTSHNKIDIYLAKYAKFVDSGTKPHYVGKEGIENIKVWAAIRGVNPWAVINSIKLYGTKPHPYLQNTKDEIDKILRDNIGDFYKFYTEKVYEKLRMAFNAK